MSHDAVSPHAWGWTQCELRDAGRQWGIPTRVGVDLLAYC